MPDKQIRRCTPNGVFSIRSAYHLELECNARQGCEASEKHNKKDVWKVCWQLQVPNMVKMFLWRALNNLLPIKGNLTRRGVVQDSVCPLCGLEEETVAHALWNCPPANGVWRCGLIKF